jgi:transcriptional regulator with XRE-family HTH domain
VTKKYRDEEWLHEKYVDEGLTQSEISELAGCGQHTISRWLREHNINTRDKSEYITHPFVGEHPKGYMEARCQAGGTDDRFYIHRLIAVSKYGFDAVCGMDVHHKSGHGLDNRHENIELRSPEGHMSEHRTEEVERGENLEERFK